MQAEIGAIAAEASVIGEAVGVASKIELVIGLIKIASREDKLGLIIAFESSARSNIENAVGAVAVISGVAAALCLESINVPGVDLRAEIAGDVGVRDRNAVNQPAYLVSAADVQLVVRVISAGNVVSDHGETVSARGAGGFLDLQTIDESRRRDGLGLRGVGGDEYRLALCRKAQLKMHDRGGAREYDDALRVGYEVCIRDRDRVFAEGNRIEMKLPRVVRASAQCELRRFRFQNNLDARNRAMLGIVDNTAHRAKNCGKTRASE